MKLLRYFSITSVIAFVFVAIILLFFYRQTALNNLIQNAESKNEALTQLFSNSMWPQFATFIQNSSSLTPEQLASHPDQKGLYQLVVSQMEGLSVVKVKVYDPTGMTVFSTDISQVGVDKSQNKGFLNALSGITTSELTHRDTFSAFEEMIEDRDVISSYVPIYAQGSIVGVFEVYDDVTPLIDRLQRTQQIIITGVVGILAILYVFLFFIVRKADTTLAAQRMELLQNAADLSLSKANLEDQVALRTLELTEANKAKDRFLARMSHELRTPLNVIIGYSEMIMEDPSEADSTVVADIQSINSSGQQLLILIESMLDISKIESELLELHYDRVYFDQLVVKIEAYAELQMSLNNNQFIITAVDLPDYFECDELRLHQMLLNLISNAAKFTINGDVALKISADDDLINFELSDTGIGIRPEFLPHVFDHFSQAEDTTSRKYDGAGLGLAITKRLCYLMGGEILAESKFGNGATFKLKIPRTPA
ncbi:MAG: sensor histidine kinase [Anaerolineae bacterium]